MKISNSKERIRYLLDFLELSQTDFSLKTGIQKSALSNYLNGDREPRQNQLSKIADAFNISPAWLMGYDVPMYYQPAASPSPSDAVVPMSSLVPEEVRLIKAYRSFNKTGKAKLMDYVADLESSPRNFGELSDSYTDLTEKDNLA